jgi:hypothetical protein
MRQGTTCDLLGTLNSWQSLKLSRKPYKMSLPTLRWPCWKSGPPWLLLFLLLRRLCNAKQGKRVEAWDQCCQMVYFQTKNPNLGKFWKVLQWKMYIGIFYGRSVYFTAKWYILWPFGTFCGHLVYFFPVLVCCTEKIWQPCLEQLLRENANLSESCCMPLTFISLENFWSAKNIPNDHKIYQMIIKWP